MEYIKLGRSGLEISPLCIGAMGFGGVGDGQYPWSLGEDASKAIIRFAIESGINFFDTANMYSTGVSEEILGRGLREFVNRDDVVIATKVYFPMRPAPNGHGLSRKAIFSEVDHSLKRLGTDYIDLYQIHRFDESTPIEETLDALNDLVRSGRVRYLGASSMRAWQFSKALHLQKANGWARFISMQHHYNLLAREEEREMLPLCADEGVGTIVWSPLARGLLARSGNQATARSQGDPPAAILYPDCEADRTILSALDRIAGIRGVSKAQVALAWLRKNPTVAAPIVGATKASHIEDAVRSLELDLTDEEISALEQPYTPRVDLQAGAFPLPPLRLEIK